MVETDSTNTDKNEAVEAASVVVIKKERGRPKKNLIIIILQLIIGRIKSSNRLDKSSVYLARIANTGGLRLTSGGLDRDPVYSVRIKPGVGPRRLVTPKK